MLPVSNDALEVDGKNIIFHVKRREDMIMIKFPVKELVKESWCRNALKKKRKLSAPQNDGRG